MALQTDMAERILGNDDDRVHIHGSRANRHTAVQGVGTAGQVRGEQRAGYETELFARAKLALMGRFNSRTIRLDRRELGQVANVRLQVGVNENHITGRNRRGAEVRAGLDHAGYTHGPVALQSTGGGAERVQADHGVDCITAVAVGIDDGRAGFDLAIRYQLSHLGQGLAGQFLHVCRNVVLVHQFGFARKLEQDGELLEGNSHVGVADGVGGRGGALSRHEVCRGDAGHLVGTGVERHQPTEDDGIGLALGLFLLCAERAENPDRLGMFEHVHFRPDEIPGGYGRIILSCHG